MLLDDLPMSWPSWPLVAACIAVYFPLLALYRLTLHPLARFPGPKWAAVTGWYEGYYDIVLNGRYMFRLAEQHDEYGPIVRINPSELHIRDPAFFDQLYRRDGRWHKDAWSYDPFAANNCTPFTTNHDDHKIRRQPLAVFLSKAKVAQRQDIVVRGVDKLCDRITAVANSTSPAASLDLGAAISAFTRDVSTEYLLGISYDNLDQDDFNIGITTVLESSGKIWRLGKHVRFVGHLIKRLPFKFMTKITDGNTASYFRYVLQNQHITRALMKSFDAPDAPEDAPNIIHEIMRSNMPAKEKKEERLINEINVTSSAAFETTASVLKVVVFHLFSQPDILRRLRDELAAATASASNHLELKALEQLPYLTAVLTEGLRLSPGVSARMARITDKPLTYGQWTIPAGTPVGMTTLMMHKDPALYPNPDDFDPDRWMDPEARKAADKLFAPFSKGTRICVGMYLAWAMLYHLVAELPRRFDIAFPEATAADFEPIADGFVINVKGRGTLQAVPSVREN